jgi:dihydroorotate dehydrogenase
MVLTDIDLFTESKVTEWKDKQVVFTDLRLRKELKHLFQQFDLIFDELAFKDVLTKKGREYFLKTEIETRLADWEKQQVNEIIRSSNKEWKKVQKSILNYSRLSPTLDKDNNSIQAQDFLQSVAPYAASVLAVPVFVKLSAISSAGLLGFFGASVISWPIALLGATLVTGLVSFGVYQSVGFNNPIVSKFSEQVKQHIEERVLFGEGSLRYELMKTIRVHADQFLEGSNA